MANSFTSLLQHASTFRHHTPAFTIRETHFYNFRALQTLQLSPTERPQTSPQGIANSFSKTTSQHTASNQTRLCTTPHAPHFSRGSPSIPPNQRTRCKTQSCTIPRSQDKGSVQKTSPHTANLTQLATSPQHLATSARDRVHLRISTTQSRCTTLTQQPHRHSTCRAAATAQFPCLLRQEQRTAEEFSTGGTAHQVHQGLAKTLPYTLQQPENKGVCRAATPARRQAPANTSQHTNIKTCSATTTQGHYIHCEDHCPNRLMWYCPALYNQAITNTFLDEQVFRTSEDSPLSHHYDLHVDVTTKLPDYQWAFRQWGHSPSIHPTQTQKRHSEKDAQSLRSLTPWAENFARPWQTFYN